MPGLLVPTFLTGRRGRQVEEGGCAWKLLAHCTPCYYFIRSPANELPCIHQRCEFHEHAATHNPPFFVSTRPNIPSTHTLTDSAPTSVPTAPIELSAPIFSRTSPNLVCAADAHSA
jgi:hypothetical protein